MPEINTYIAGVKYRPGAGDELDALGFGEVLTLEPEPDNKFDETAIRILHKDTHLGYIPSFLSAKVSDLFNSHRIEKATKANARNITIHYTGEEDPDQG